MRNALVVCLVALLLAADQLHADPPQTSAPPPEAPLATAAPDPQNADPPDSSEEAAPNLEASPHAERFWVQSEYLLWRIKHSDLPILITTGSPADARPGALGMGGTQPLFGGPNQDNNYRSGGRFSGGLWLDDDGAWGVEGNYLFLGTRSIGMTAAADGSAGSPVIARPFFDVLGNQEDASLVALPGLVGGRVVVAASSFLQGAEASAAMRLWHGEHHRVTLLAGFRYLQLDDDLQITESTQVSPGAPVFPGAAIGVADYFRACNDFYGGQLGVRAELKHKRWDLTAVAKVALGATHEVVDIVGTTAITSPGQSQTLSSGGLLALASNGGRHSRDVFAVVPEVGVNLGLHLTKHFRAFVGYSFLYSSAVARPGDQVDRSVNLAQVPTSQLAGTPGGPARPAFSFAGTDFWAQGVNFGLEFRY